MSCTNQKRVKSQVLGTRSSAHVGRCTLHLRKLPLRVRSVASKSETPLPRDPPKPEIYRQYYNVTSPASSTGSFIRSLKPDEDPSAYDTAYYGYPLSPPWFNEHTPLATSPQSIQLFEADSHSPFLTIPSTVVHRDLVGKLIKEAAYMGYQKGTEKAEEDQKRKEDEFDRAYRAGVASVITLCMSPFPTNMANMLTVGNNQGLDKTMAVLSPTVSNGPLASSSLTLASCTMRLYTFPSTGKKYIPFISVLTSRL